MAKFIVEKNTEFVELRVESYEDQRGHTSRPERAFAFDFEKMSMLMTVPNVRRQQERPSILNL